MRTAEEEVRAAAAAWVIWPFTPFGEQVGPGPAAEEAAEAGAGAGIAALPAGEQLRLAKDKIKELRKELRKCKPAKTNKILEPSLQVTEVTLNRRWKSSPRLSFLMLILVVWCVVATILAATCLPCRKEEGED